MKSLSNSNLQFFIRVSSFAFWTLLRSWLDNGHGKEADMADRSVLLYIQVFMSANISTVRCSLLFPTERSIHPLIAPLRFIRLWHVTVGQQKLFSKLKLVSYYPNCVKCVFKSANISNLQDLIFISINLYTYYVSDLDKKENTITCLKKNVVQNHAHLILWLNACQNKFWLISCCRFCIILKAFKQHKFDIKRLFKGRNVPNWG